MDQANSFSEFFYNLIPGSLLIFGIIFLKFEIFEAFYKDNTKDGVFYIFCLVLLSLLIGFILQGLTKITEEIRGLKWRQRLVFNYIAEGETQKLYDEAFKKIELKFGSKYPEGTLDKKNYKENLYLMDNFIRSKTDLYIIHHFSTKAAFWLNLTWVWLFLFLAFLCLLPREVLIIDTYHLGFFIDWVIVSFVLLISTSFCVAIIYMRNQYNSTLSTFLAIE